MVTEQMLSELNATLTNYNISNASSIIDMGRMRNVINKMFPDSTCVDVLYTENTDNIFFGIVVNPVLSTTDMLNLLFGEEPVSISRYYVEFDSKLLTTGLTNDEICAYLIYEIDSMISSIAPINELRAIIDNYIASEDDCIAIRESIGYSQILIFAIKDALRKLTSSIYKDNTDELLSNELINSLEISDFLMSALMKVRSSVFGIGSTVKEPNLVLLKWAFDIYRDVKHRGAYAIEILKESLIATGSKLIKGEINKTIECIRRVVSEIEVTTEQVMQEAKSGGLFSNLKRNGLRAIEDDLYEFTIRVKNADTEEDAYYALRQINTRINLLEEYIATSNLTEAEEKHWRDVALRFRDLRAQLSNKKIIDKRSYGLFFNYDELDNL